LEWWHSLEVEVTAFITVGLMVVTIPWVLMTKRDSTSAVAWCLFIFFVPIFGSLLFVLFGYQHIQRPLRRKRKHKRIFGMTHSSPPAKQPEDPLPVPEDSWRGMARLAEDFGAMPVQAGNQITFYHDGNSAIEAIREAIRSARHHIHMEYFIFEPDETGRSILELLTEKAREGVEVRLLLDAMGSRWLRRRLLKPLVAAGGKCREFLPLNPLRRRIQINMRDHRKITVVDGRVAFTGGLNIGDEYLGKSPRYGFWRDTHMRLEGPAVAELQRVFIEGWDFAAEEDLRGASYFPPLSSIGPLAVQVIPSGPDMELKSIRQIYFAAILRAQKRLWIASPYFVPDAGLRDALCLAGHLGIDVRLLCQFHPDKWIPFFAARYYWADVLEAGVKVYQYVHGMMHSKVVLVDGEWASVGTANLDNRSLYLNFEVNCLIYSAPAVAELETAFRTDLKDSILVERTAFSRRPLPARLVENACRLLSPVL
jgi:cardiolipin synthase